MDSFGVFILNVIFLQGKAKLTLAIYCFDCQFEKLTNWIDDWRMKQKLQVLRHKEGNFGRSGYRIRFDLWLEVAIWDWEI